MPSPPTRFTPFAAMAPVGVWIASARAPDGASAVLIALVLVLSLAAAGRVAGDASRHTVAARGPLLVATAAEGLGIGVCIGFAFGTSRALVTTSFVLWVVAHTAGVAAVIVSCRGAHPRSALHAWRRLQVASLALCAVAAALVLPAGERADGVRLLGTRLDVSRLALFAVATVSVLVEGALVLSARAAMESADGDAPGRPHGRPARPVPGDSVVPYGPPRPPST